jgi:cytochrome c-type biogenesis protein CcmH
MTMHSSATIKFALVLLLISSCLLATDSSAQVDTFQFETPDQQLRFRHLSNELRCPMCQNTNLSGSTGGVAQDLRREIHRMILEGMTDREIEQFMFDRYGDFIFYRPRLRAETILLWFGPLLFLLIGAFTAYRIVRRSSKSSAAVRDFTEADNQKLDQLLIND